MEVLCRYNDHPGTSTWRENWFGTGFVRGGKICLPRLYGEDGEPLESENCVNTSNSESSPTVEFSCQDLSDIDLGSFV